MLPYRNSLPPLRIGLTAPLGLAPVIDHLRAVRPHEQWADVLAAADVVSQDGRPVAATDRYRTGAAVYCYLTPPPEIPVPFELSVVYADDVIVVVDKPHFLATIPRGEHVTETATVRVRRLLDCDELTPAHRLDRMTAGLVLFVRDRRHRRAYQELFSSRSVEKEYEAIAGYRPDLEFPRDVRTRIEKEHGVMVARHVPGEPNSHTHVELLESYGAQGRYRLRPITGRTHQLRIHLASIGIPIRNDNYYPTYRPAPRGDFSTPLALLARRLRFADPITGAPREFSSDRELELR